jgi:hypothetical protein
MVTWRRRSGGRRIAHAFLGTVPQCERAEIEPGTMVAGTISPVTEWVEVTELTKSGRPFGEVCVNCRAAVFGYRRKRRDFES